MQGKDNNVSKWESNKSFCLFFLFIHKVQDFPFYSNYCKLVWWNDNIYRFVLCVCLRVYIYSLVFYVNLNEIKHKHVFGYFRYSTIYPIDQIDPYIISKWVNVFFSSDILFHDIQESLMFIVFVFFSVFSSFDYYSNIIGWCYCLCDDHHRTTMTKTPVCHCYCSIINMTCMIFSLAIFFHYSTSLAHTHKYKAPSFDV